MYLQIWLTSQHIANFGWVLLGDLLLQRPAFGKEAAHIICGGWCPIFRRLWTKVHKIWASVEDFSQFPTPFPVFYGLFLSEDIRHEVSNSSKTTTCVTFFGPSFFQEGRPHFYGRLLARFSAYRLPKFCWVPFADLRVRSLAMK